jgi:3-hydroxyacyl-[acyl-carrier-protein] dehydratase
MAPPLFVDPAGIDFNNVVAGVEEIERVNPHRFGMRMLDGLVYINRPDMLCVAYKDVRHDEFWVPGHIPGRPLFPGVLMIEAAAQLASYLAKLWLNIESFMGFAGVDAVKFRGQVVPGDRLVLLGKGVDLRPRRCICDVQGVVRGALVFEARVTGMPI